jgi:hypothetical protein
VLTRTCRFRRIDLHAADDVFFHPCPSLKSFSQVQRTMTPGITPPWPSASPSWTDFAAPSMGITQGIRHGFPSPPSADTTPRIDDTIQRIDASCRRRTGRSPSRMPHTRLRRPRTFSRGAASQAA